MRETSGAGHGIFRQEGAVRIADNVTFLHGIVNITRAPTADAPLVAERQLLGSTASAVVVLYRRPMIGRGLLAG